MKIIWIRPTAMLATLLLGGRTVCAADGLNWREVPGGRAAPLPSVESRPTGFTRMGPEVTGVFFTNDLPRWRYMTNQVLPSGSGVTAGDVDGDGMSDLFFAGLNSTNRLYRNRGGWRFEDITEASGLVDTDLDTTGTTLADLDGDGDLDLVLNTVGQGTRLWWNDGTGHFTESPPINLDRAGMTSALADVDGDGDLDLYIANYRVTSTMDRPQTRFSVRMIDGRPVVAMIDGRPVTDPDLTNRFNFNIQMEGGRGRLAYEENGEPDALYRNDGSGRFTLVSFTDGTFRDEQGNILTQAPYDWGLTAMLRDFTGDGHPDIYVCNDFGAPDRIWVNDGSGRFQAIAPLAVRQTSLASMAMDVADINRDGFDDLFVTDMLSREHARRLTQRNILRADLAPASRVDSRPQYPRNTLLLNRGDGTFAEVAQYAGIEASEWSWTPIFLDVDLDGLEDLLVPNGFVRDNMNLDALARIDAAKAGRRLSPFEELQLRREFPILNTRNLAFRNLGGARFEEVSRAWRFDSATISQGMCLADLDNDGDLDVLVNNLNDDAGLYRNDSAAPRVAVRLKGQPPNTRGIGARILLRTPGLAVQSQQMIAGGRYLSGDDAIRLFAAGDAGGALQLEVQWRGGKRSVLQDVRPNHLYEVHESQAGDSATSATPPEPVPVFADVSELLGHTHVDQPYDDFQRQPLLSRRLSQQGPAVAWFDLDSDGHDDLIVSSGTGGRLGVFLNDGRGGFAPVHKPPYTELTARDQTAVLGWHPIPGRTQILVGASDYEDVSAGGGGILAVEFSSPEPVPFAPRLPTSCSTLALADVDGDGDLDLFAGGRARGGQYPFPGSSILFRNTGGRLDPDELNRSVLENIGLVNGATFADLTGDGLPELILACEWGPVRVLTNNRGVFRDTTEEMGLADYTGWWNGVHVGDFDGDGRLDLVASNWGRNTPYERRRGHPQRIYYGDLDGDGLVDLITAHYEPSLQDWVPNRMLDHLSRAIPYLSERFPSHEEYAHASIEQVLAEHRGRAQFLEATWFESAVFLNRGDRWEPCPLPMAAQLAPAFGICVADYDGDGHQDIFLSQNFFGVELDTSRYDAGRGLWLRGKGDGDFVAVPGQESGITIYGEQRGAAVGDFDGDHRVDLVVTQNSASTRLFRNLRGTPGLRVRLRGPAGNPTGIGALLRLSCGALWGPAYPVTAGAGYASQDSTIKIIGHGSATPAEISVTWPDGRRSQVPIEAGCRELIVTYE